jgi:6-phosphogluconolactonase/glucosamine-6-phosphate isomerase/deaminase
MSKAKITDRDGFDCAPNGHTIVNFPFGEVVEGRVAEWALAEKAAKRLFDKKPPETKVQPRMERK